MLLHFLIRKLKKCKIVNLILLVVSNFDFGLLLKLFTHLVLLLYLIMQLWSPSPDLDVGCYKWTLTNRYGTCRDLELLWELYLATFTNFRRIRRAKEASYQFMISLHFPFRFLFTSTLFHPLVLICNVFS